MPAYGKQISAPQMTALVTFLTNLRPPGQPAARAGRQPGRQKQAAMNPAFDAFLRSWPFNPLLVFSLAMSAAIYFRGWRRASSPRSRPLERRTPGGFFGWIDGGVPCAGLADRSLFVDGPVDPHGAAHAAADGRASADLAWRSDLVFLRGLPESVRRYWITPLLRARSLQRFFGRLTHPLVALPLFVGTIWLWHAPVIYEWALRSDVCHYAEHASFLATALVVLVSRDPARGRVDQAGPTGS